MPFLLNQTIKAMKSPSSRRQSSFRCTNNNKNNRTISGDIKKSIVNGISHFKCSNGPLMKMILICFYVSCFTSSIIGTCDAFPLRRNEKGFTGIADENPSLLDEHRVYDNDYINHSSTIAYYYTENLTDYLIRFGYLSQFDEEAGGVIVKSKDRVKTAIKNMQAFANIPVTGEFDIRTQSLLRRPRCGVVDILPVTLKKNKRYSIQGQKWLNTNLTWSLENRILKKLDTRRVKRELHRAFDVWANNSRLSFTEVDIENHNNSEADIEIGFHTGVHGDGYSFDGRGMILAHAFFPGTGRGGDIHFDEDESWQLEGDNPNNTGISLFSVAIHELGHSLGLSHSSVSGALMYPWYLRWKRDFKLPDDDRIAIQKLYGSKVGKEEAEKEQEQDQHIDVKKNNKSPEQNSGTDHNETTTTITSKTGTTTELNSSISPTSLLPLPPRVEKPDTCDTEYDAISVIRDDVFIFKGQYMWRITKTEGLHESYPVKISLLWSELPLNLTSIDTVYERLDSKIVFFIGRKYYVFDAATLEKGYPKDIQTLGLPQYLDHIDGAMVWGFNSKTYFFSGTMYWRFNEESQLVEENYPKDLSLWRGVGYFINDVFQWKNSTTYFFKGKGFWKFNDKEMKVENRRQALSAPVWMGCRPHDDDNNTFDLKKTSLDNNHNITYVYNVNTNIYEVKDWDGTKNGKRPAANS